MFLLHFRAQNMIQLVAKDCDEPSGSKLQTIVSFPEIQQNSFFSFYFFFSTVLSRKNRIF